MFSCALYPGTPGFLASVEREIRHQVKRLRDHPCIALWCGNNEDVGALTWFPESRQNRDRYIVDYDRLNEGVIGRVVDECDPTRTFWPSSPSAGRGDYSDNWHDDSARRHALLERLARGQAVQRLTTRSRRDSAPSSATSPFPRCDTIRSYAAPEDFNVTSPVMEHHQRHPRGNSVITEMFTRYFRVPEGFENFVYLSQVQQALAIKTAVEYWRSPAAHLHGHALLAAQRQLAGLLVVLHRIRRLLEAPALRGKDGSSRPCLSPRICRMERWRPGLRTTFATEAVGMAVISLLDFQGNVIRREEKTVRAPAGSAKLVKSHRLADLGAAPEKAFMHVSLVQGSNRGRKRAVPDRAETLRSGAGKGDDGLLRDHGGRILRPTCC